MQAVPIEVIHFVDVDRARKDRMQQAARRRFVPRGHNVEHFFRLDLPLLPQHDAQLARLREKMGGKFLVRRQIVESHVLDRMTKGPMPDVVQQSRAQQNLGPVPINDLAKSRVLAQLTEIADGVVKDAERMLEPRVRGSRINARRQPELRDVLQSLKLRRIDDRPDARREWDVQLHRNPHQPEPRFQVGQLGDFKQWMRHVSHSLVAPLLILILSRGCILSPAGRIPIRTPRPCGRDAPTRSTRRHRESPREVARE